MGVVFQQSSDQYLKNMKIAIALFIAFFGVVNCNDLFIGQWKEDQYKRTGLNDFLWARDLNAFKRLFVTQSSYELTMNIVKNGNKFVVNGKRDLIKKTTVLN